jgi:hypothetical protein
MVQIRDVKDPVTLAKAAARLASEPIEVEQLGAFLEPRLVDELRRLTQGCAAYRLLGGLPHDDGLATSPPRARG